MSPWTNEERPQSLRRVVARQQVPGPDPVRQGEVEVRLPGPAVPVHLGEDEETVAQVVGHPAPLHRRDPGTTTGAKGTVVAPSTKYYSKTLDWKRFWGVYGPTVRESGSLHFTTVPMSFLVQVCKRLVPESLPGHIPSSQRRLPGKTPPGPTPLAPTRHQRRLQGG